MGQKEFRPRVLPRLDDWQCGKKDLREFTIKL